MIGNHNLTGHGIFFISSCRLSLFLSTNTVNSLWPVIWQGITAVEITRSDLFSVILVGLFISCCNLCFLMIPVKFAFDIFKSSLMSPKMKKGFPCVDVSLKHLRYSQMIQL